MPASLPKLQTQVVISLLLGVAAGLFFGDYCAFLEPVGRAFLMLLKMSILPYMSLALIHSLAGLDPKSARYLLTRLCLVLFLFWSLTIALIYFLTQTFPETSITVPYSTAEIPVAADVNLLKLFIPVNPIHALANDIVPAVVLFSLLFGLALLRTKNKQIILNALEPLIDGLMKITSWILQLSPLGIFALIAYQVGTTPLMRLGQLQSYLIAYWAGCLVVTLWLFPALVATITPIPHLRFLRAIRPVLLLSFSTANNLVAIPLMIHALRNLTEHYSLKTDRKEGTIETVVPISYNFPTAGNLLSLLFLLYLAHFYSTPLGFFQHLQLSFLSLPILFGSANSTLLAISFLVDQIRLPIDGYALFTQTIPFTRNVQVLASSCQMAAVTTIVFFLYHKSARFHWPRLLIQVGVGIFLLTLVVFAMQRVQIPIQPIDKLYESLTIKEQVEAEVVSRNYPHPEGPRSLDTIRKSGVLRVGFYESAVPFAYFNNKGELVGYDIAVAHKIAKALNCRIQFVPLIYQELRKDLENGLFDIAMSAVTVTDERLQNMSFSDPYIRSEVVLLGLDPDRSYLKDSSLLYHDRQFKLAVFKGTSFVPLAHELFPNAVISEVSSTEEYMEGNFDALLWSAVEATSWALTHPRYAVVYPEPPLGVEPLAYAVSSKVDDTTTFLNYWLELHELDGTLGKLRVKWIFGKEPEREQRWSILRNVLKL